jgi:hydrogenase expression/formation protein HypC
MCLAVPGKIESIEGSDPVLRSGKVNFGGIIKQINLAYVPEAQVGDYVLVHVGFAISTIEESEAQEVFEYLRQLGEIAELEDGRQREVDGQP